MATFDQLSAEQRAIIELLLQRGQSYAELSDKLGMPEKRARDLARDALVRLAPVTARKVDEEWRGQLADYVLGQQSGPESTATRGHLRRSEAARSWARSLLDSLDTLYSDEMPTIPDADGRGGRSQRDKGGSKPAGAAAVADPAAKPRRPLGGAASDAVKRRRLMAGAGALSVLLLLAVLVWPIGVLTGDDDEGGDGGQEQASQASQPAANNAASRGQALIFENKGKRQILVSATGLRPSSEKQAYQVWLYNSQKSAKSLGYAVTDNQGRLQGGSEMPADSTKYKFVEISLEPIDKNQGHSGQTALRGANELLKKPVFQGKGKNRVKVVGNISMVPLP